MKNLFAAAVTSIIVSSATAAPNVIFSFGSDELESFFKERKYTEIIQQAAEEVFGNAGDAYTIALMGDYSMIDNNKRCLYSINAFISVKYKNSIVIDMNQAGISRFMGTHVAEKDNCSKGVTQAIEYVGAQSINHIKNVLEAKETKKLQTPKNQKQI